MERAFKDRFLDLWNRYFPGAELPIGLFYTDEQGRAEPAPVPKGQHCVIADLTRVRRGKPLAFGVESLGCAGGKRYLGFEQELRPGFEFFLSCGIPGQMEGERYKKTPELVKEHLKHHPGFEAPGRYVVFKRWDALEERDDPAVVIFFAPPDVLSGLFTLANFDEPEPNGVIAPFGSGCASIVDYPYREIRAPRPRAVLGMFDVSARPCVPGSVLTFAVPWPKFTGMVANMEESFLTTGSWAKVRRRIEKEAQGDPG